MMNGNRFDGKVALITGAARGIGRGIALCLAEEGADIVLNDLEHGDATQETAEAIEQVGRRVLVCPADVSDRDAVVGVFERAVAHFGHVDIVAANAGFSIREPVIEAEWDHVRQIIAVCQLGVFHTCQLAAQQMVKQMEAGRAGGKIVIIGSIMGELSIADSAAYNMAKAAIINLGRTLANELAAQRINVNVINPGWIDTPGERRYSSEEEIAAGGARLPWGRLGTPRDIGKAAAFLVSDDAEYISGAALRVDGGYMAAVGLANA